MVTMRGLARRIQMLNSETKALDSMLTNLVNTTALNQSGFSGGSVI